MNDYNKLWSKAIASRNALAPEGAVEPVLTGPVIYNAIAADAPAAKREDSIRAICRLAGREDKAAAYLQAGIPYQAVLDDLTRLRARSLTH